MGHQSDCLHYKAKGSGAMPYICKNAALEPERYHQFNKQTYPSQSLEWNKSTE